MRKNQTSVDVKGLRFSLNDLPETTLHNLTILGLWVVLSNVAIPYYNDPIAQKRAMRLRYDELLAGTWKTNMKR